MNLIEVSPTIPDCFELFKTIGIGRGWRAVVDRSLGSQIVKRSLGERERSRQRTCIVGKEPGRPSQPTTQDWITTCQRLHTFKHVHTATTHDLSRPLPSYLGPSYDLPWPTHDLHCLHYESLLMGVYIGHLLRPPTLFPDRQFFFYTPASKKLKRGYTGFTLSICPSVDRTVSALYPLHICTSYQATSEGVSRVKLVSKLNNLKFGKFLKFVTLTLSYFDMGSNMTK